VRRNGRYFHRFDSDETILQYTKKSSIIQHNLLQESKRQKMSSWVVFVRNKSVLMIFVRADDKSILSVLPSSQLT
jgi:tRNA threonylcarbamoyladenosine modification (KEOPS) complex  Pcc1 subunit